MKIRNSFVANSSSSSFLVMTTKENHEHAMSNLHPYVQKVMEAICSSDQFVGKQVVYYGDLSTMDGYSYTFEDLCVEWDGDYGCALEHGDLFRRLPHIRVSHH